MKKRFLLRSLSSLISLSVVLSYGMCVFAVETDDQEFAEENSDIIVVEDPVSVDVDYDDYELAEGFIYQKLSLGKPVCYNKFDYEANLSGYELVVYNYLLPFISEIANGERTSTVITIPEDVLSIDLTAEDLGLEDLTTATNQEITAAVKNHFPVDTTKLWLSFIETCPYEMYWYDKTKGCSTAYKLSRKGSSYIHLYNYKVTFCVSEEYQDGDDKTVNSVFGEAVNSAAANVRSIINEYAGLDDYHKLLAYNNKICLLTDYNYPAYENTDTPYGNPWQLIWVFDGDDSTKVVCEGYAKAFQYLCDNSAFRDDSLYVLSLYGSCNDGGHMWNLVHMDDGSNYLVDVTHSDPGGDGNFGIKNFLKGATSGSASSGYTVNNKLYKYNPALVDYYGEDTVSLASSDYVYVDPDGKHSVVLSSVSNGSAVLSKDSALEGEEITVTVTPKEGYELNYITVNDTVIYGNTFTMPSENVFINVVCAKIRYWISVDFDPYGGGVSYPGKLPEGATATINAIPRNGYVLDYIKVDDEIITGNTFTMPAHDVNVYVAFKKASYSIYVGITGPGSIETSDNKANPGDVVTITSIPDEGYKLDSISVYDHDYNPISVKNNAFTMPESDVTVYATFVKADYNVTLAEAQNGTATLSASVAQMGDTVTVTASPATGYELDSIKVNGTKISGKTFTMPASDTTVEVTFKKISYAITVAQADGGTVGVSKTSANYGDTITVTTTPEEGYKLSAIKVNGETISGNSFSMPADNVEVSATFVKADYNVTLSEVQNGTATLSALVANMGDTITVTVSPATGYELDSIKVNSTKISGKSFTMPAADTSVEVTFKKILYTISVVQSSGGTIGVSKTSANFGDVITVTVTPNEGYTLNTLKMNGTAISGKSFSMPAENVEVSASFVKAEYKVTLASVQNGTASLSASVANMGDAITVIVSPAIGYELDSIKVNGMKISGNSFTMPAADVTVEVAFKAITYTVTLTYDAELVAVEGIAATDSSRFGDKYEFKVTPVEGYEILSVKVNGAEISAFDDIYTVTQPDEDIEIVIELSEIYVPKSGWITEDGNKYYFEDDNPVKGWYRIAGSWYFFNADGIMQTGWVKDGSSWYYLDGSGVMATGWFDLDGKWYYLKSSGVMATGWNKISGKWYYLESSGTMVSGWKQISGKWYYFEVSGSMVTGWKKIGGKWYVFDTSGAMKTGWYKEGNTWYYLTSDGSMATGWLETGGKWYYFYSSGAMALNTTIDGYKLGNDGAWIK
ncbi:InlB B-repeat-containing protein [Butyrivibrio sp. AE2032]|uniref:InlB B-repeat-containing protein n=1 Tax=Butyrivibrio sp. AE2032 TaxID=1458463 RepID=UPI00068B8B0C|nr:MucBP domain-containing protein [Butyrivibrio sp. AE2032]